MERGKTRIGQRADQSGNNRYEKEFEGVQDVFELQVRSFPEEGVSHNDAQLYLRPLICKLQLTKINSET